MEESNKSSYLEKSVWDEKDFEKMEWHDTHIHGISFGTEWEDGTADLLLDINYIFQWVKPIPPDRGYSFWIAPCTLVFENAYNLKVEIDDKVGYAFGPFEIDDLMMVGKNKTRTEGILDYEWDIKLQTGTIKLKSYGFKQFVRRQPVYFRSRYLKLEERGGVSFAKVSVEV